MSWKGATTPSYTPEISLIPAQTYYTNDGFKSDPKVLVDDRRMCQWAKSSERFLEGQDKHDSRILCITRGKYSDRSKDFRLLMTDK